MKYTNTIIRNGETITLTADEVNNIYRYQRELYRIADARHHVNAHILQYTDRNDESCELDLNTVSDEDLLPESSENDILKFHKLLNLTNDDLEALVECFEDRFDCNLDENSIWDNIIDEYLKKL